MTLILITLAVILLIVGIVGSVLPVLPGVPISWLGLLAFYLIPGIEIDYWFLGITLVVAITIYILEMVIPAMGTKKYGGSKAGMIGTTVGLIVGIFIPIPFAILIGPFVGAFIGEIINKSDSKTALRAAYGSFIGFLASTFMEFMVALIFFVLFLYKGWGYRDFLFGNS
ncbi:DUF456 domain-containing protein [Zunongwangia endophytica]|uniref:DUF456 domain-containing protein n=1 Tax=Zunongwangia endophytica TaxID=1808945 RepID=A0ABV8H7R7_9FLAO|nr:DUF456 domain-containing protein [Zunongwangia endophytica]MDN3595492.1 DUF456 domain-containing protein [Zunongwangia endophytica]